MNTRLVTVLGLVVALWVVYGNSAMAQAPKPVKPSAQVVTEPIHINKASADELQAIKGVGPALAERIMNYRDANGSFKTVDELKEVKGIGDAKFEKIKSQVTL